MLLPTAYVVRREGYVLTRVCPSVCPHLGGDTPARSDRGVGGGKPGPGWWGGGYSSQVQPEGGTPAREYSSSGTPIRPGQRVLDLARGTPAGGGTPARGYPTSDSPHQAGGVLDLAREYLCWGVPPLGTTSPHQIWLGGIPAGGYSTLGNPHKTWPGGYPCWGVPHLR